MPSCLLAFGLTMRCRLEGHTALPVQGILEKTSRRSPTAMPFPCSGTCGTSDFHLFSVGGKWAAGRVSESSGRKTAWRPRRRSWGKSASSAVRYELANVGEARFWPPWWCCCQPSQGNRVVSCLAPEGLNEDSSRLSVLIVEPRTRLRRFQLRSLLGIHPSNTAESVGRRH